MQTSPKHALFLSIDGMTDPLGQSQVLPYLAGLSAAGYRISIISCEKPDRLAENRAAIEAICREAGIRWLPIPYRTRPPLVSSVANIRLMRRRAEQLHREQPVDLVHCRSYLPMFAGLILKKKFGLPVLFDIRGFWPDERVDGGLWDLHKPLWRMVYRFFKRKERTFFESADHVITLTEAAKREIHSWPLRNNPVPISVIPCCADLALFDYGRVDHGRRIELMRRLGLSEQDRVITYLGSLGTFYAIDDMLAYFKAYKEQVPEGKFLIITASPESLVWEAADRLGIARDDLRVAKAGRREVPLYLSLGRYSLVFYRENFSRKGCSPTKLGELMGLGIPVVCSPNVGDTTAIVNDTGAGITLESLTPEAYHRAVSAMEGFQPKPEAIREGACTWFDLESGIEKYLAVYSKLTA